MERFFDCLAALLSEEEPELAALEAPCTELWQELQNALNALPDEEVNERTHSMNEKEIKFTCAYCGQDTTIIVKVAKPLATSSKPVPVPRYCEHCNKPNRVPIPDNIDVHVFILGKDQGFLGYTPEGIPHLQGEKY